MFQWSKDGMDLPGENQNTLELHLVNATDGGDYTCMASSTAGNASFSATLYVRPYIIAHPQQQVLASVLDTVMFICEAAGFPSPSYRWERDGSVQSMDQTYTFVAFHSSGGMYTCVAFSTVNSMELTAESEVGQLIGEKILQISFCISSIAVYPA